MKKNDKFSASKAEIYVHLITKKESKLAQWLIEEKKRPSLKRLFLLYRSKKQLPKADLYTKVFETPFSTKKDFKLRHENRLLITTIFPVFGFFGEVHPMKEQSPLFVLLDRMADNQYLELFESEIKKATDSALAIDDYKVAGKLYYIWVVKTVLYHQNNKTTLQKIKELTTQAKQVHIKYNTLQIRQIEVDEAYVYSRFKGDSKTKSAKFSQMNTIDLNEKINNTPKSLSLFHAAKYYYTGDATDNLKSALKYAKQSNQIDKERHLVIISALLAINYHNNNLLDNAIHYYELTLEHPEMLILANVQSLHYKLILALLQNGETKKANIKLSDSLSDFKLTIFKKELHTLKILALCLLGNFTEAATKFPKDLKADFDSWYYQQNRMLQALIWFHTNKKDLAYNEVTLLTKHFSYTKTVNTAIKKEFELLKNYINWQDAVNKNDRDVYLHNLQNAPHNCNEEAHPIHIFVHQTLKKTNFLNK